TYPLEDGLNQPYIDNVDSGQLAWKPPTQIARSANSLVYTWVKCSIICWNKSDLFTLLKWLRMKKMVQWPPAFAGLYIAAMEDSLMHVQLSLLYRCEYRFAQSDVARDR